MHFGNSFFVSLIIFVFGIVLIHLSNVEAQGLITQNSPAHAKLAVIDTGENPPPNYLIRQFQTTLDSIHSKCSAGSKTLIGDYIVWGRNELKKSGKPISLIQFAKATDKSIPPDAASLKLKCSEVVAVLVTLIQAQ